jgi:hypothetical protein
MRRFVIIASAAIVLASCEFRGNRRIRGNGTASSQLRSVGSFSKVDVSGPYEVIVTQGDAESVRVEADENLQQYIEVVVQGDQLEIDTRDGINIRPRKDIKIYITAPLFRALSVTGSGDVKSTSKLTSDRIALSVTGSGDIMVDIDAPVVETEITGSGSININGNTRTLNAEINGSGEVHAFSLMSENTDVEISGSGEAEVFASKGLEVSIAGSGDVAYKGTASVNQSIAGSGNIRKVD